MQVDELRAELGVQQGTLQKLAEQMLDPAAVQSAIDDAPQVQAIQACLKDLRKAFGNQQQAQEIQANALREGLMEIHEHRAAVTKQLSDASAGAVPAADAAEPQTWIGRAELQRWRTQLAGDLAELRAAMEVPARQAAEAMELHSQLAEELAEVTRQAEEQWASLAQDIRNERLTRVNQAGELCATLRAAVVRGADHLGSSQQTVAADHLGSGEADAVDLADDVEEGPEQLELKLAALRSERERRLVEIEAQACRPQMSLEEVRAAFEKLEDSMSKEQAERRAQSGAIFARVEDLATQLDARVGEFAIREVELVNEVARVASQVDALPRTNTLKKGQNDMRELAPKLPFMIGPGQLDVTVQCADRPEEPRTPPREPVLALIREAQEALRCEFASRLADVETRIHRPLTLQESGPLPKSPLADTDGLAPTSTSALATRLAAIKGQLRAEIETRIERSPEKWAGPAGLGLEAL